jgi:hypothetical protein
LGIKVINITVENAVEKLQRIRVSDSPGKLSALCTEVRAGTSVVRQTAEISAHATQFSAQA